MRVPGSVYLVPKAVIRKPLWARGVVCIPTWTQWEMLNSEARSLFVSRALYVQIHSKINNSTCMCMYHTISRDVRVEETQTFIVNLRLGGQRAQ